MSRFFIPTDNIDGDTLKITGSDAHHITHVLRMAKGDSVTVCDMGRREYKCVISGFADGEVILGVVSSGESRNEPSVSVTLYQGLPKSDKLEQIIQKAVELGVSAVVPVEAERSIVKVSSGYERKAERFNAVSLSAAKQCGRAFVPPVQKPVKFAEAARMLSRHRFSFICYEGEDVIPIGDLAKEAFAEGADDIGFYIGPEGGLSLSELEYAKALSIPLCGLGSRILRTETASGCVLSVLMLLSGNLQ